MSGLIDQPQPPLLDELPDEALEEPPAEAAAEEPLAVIAAPEGATSHHLAPKLSLPWPLILPGPESAMK